MIHCFKLKLYTLNLSKLNKETYHSAFTHLWYIQDLCKQYGRLNILVGNYA